MTCQHSDLIIFEDGRTLNLARVVATEWYTPPPKRGKPAPARELLITTDIIFKDEQGVEGPYLIFVGEGAEELWEIIRAYARPPLPAPSSAPVVTLEPFTLDEGDRVPAGTSYRAGEAEVFVDSRDDTADPEVYLQGVAGAVSLSRFLEAARAVEAIASDPRFMDRQHAPAPPVFASAAD